ncbi:MAG TPA: hypothetical protein VI039_13150 [Solirubrobacterales bacterium]
MPEVIGKTMVTLSPLDRERISDQCDSLDSQGPGASKDATWLRQKFLQGGCENGDDDAAADGLDSRPRDRACDHAVDPDDDGAVPADRSSVAGVAIEGDPGPEHALVELEYSAPRGEEGPQAGWRFYCSCGARGTYHRDTGHATHPRERERCESLARYDHKQHAAALSTQQQLEQSTTGKARCATCEDEGQVAKNFGLFSPGRPEIVPCPDCSTQQSTTGKEDCER